MMVQGNYSIDQPEENLTGRALINFTTLYYNDQSKKQILIITHTTNPPAFKQSETNHSIEN